MKTIRHPSFFNFKESKIGPAFLFLFLILLAASAFGETTELLSDAVISDITAGEMGDTVVTAFYETPSTVYIDSEPRWWGDADGLGGYGTACANNPGFVVASIPYPDFQYDTFKYTFKNQADLDNFLKDINENGQHVNVLSTDYIKSNPGADHVFSSDGRAPRIQEIIITTDQKVNGGFVRAHNGQVITQDVRLDFEFLPPYAKSYTVNATSGDRADRRSSSLVNNPVFRNNNRYEWVQNYSPGAEIVRRQDGTFYFIESEYKTYNFGAIFLETNKTDDSPLLSASGHVIVPPDTAYLRNTIFNDIHVYSPVVGLTIGLAPHKKVATSSGTEQELTYYPDFDRYQELGLMEIRGLNITIEGGNDIYIYANEDLDVCH
jgi:hypothetical protein